MGIYGQYVFVCFKTRWGSPQKNARAAYDADPPEAGHETPGFPPGSPNEASQIELPENPRAPWKAIAEKKISRPIL